MSYICIYIYYIYTIYIFITTDFSWGCSVSNCLFGIRSHRISRRGKPGAPSSARVTGVTFSFFLRSRVRERACCFSHRQRFESSSRTKPMELSECSSNMYICSNIISYRQYHSYIIRCICVYRFLLFFLLFLG